jgi:hypothetical protein
MYFIGTGVQTQGFTLAKQILHHFSHISRPFCSGYLRDKVLFFTWVGLEL